jgi:hypothetical protein
MKRHHLPGPDRHLSTVDPDPEPDPFLPESYCPARINRGRNQAQTMRSDKLFFQKYLVFSIKCTPSRKEQKPVSAS